MSIFTIHSSFGQTTVNFELENSGYTLSGDATGSGTTDLFNRTSSSGFGGNNTFFMAYEDFNGLNPSTLTINQINISGSTSFNMAIDLLTPNTLDWDIADQVIVSYSIDGGTFVQWFAIESIPDGDNFNAPAALDLNNDGDGDSGQELPAITDSASAGVSNTFQTFNIPNVALSGNSTLDIKFDFYGLTSGDEGIYIDNIVISNSSGNVGPSISSISNSPMTPTSSDMVTVSADFTDADGIASATLRWGTTSGNLTNSVSMSNTSGNTYTGSIPSQADGTTVYYTVEATDSNASPETTVSSENNYNVINPIITTIPYTIDFTSNNPELNNWSYQSVSGSQNWSWANGTGAQMNAFSGSCQINEDWLISPVFDFSTTLGENISFTIDENFDGTTLEVLYSTDYSGTGDPNTATWNSIGSYTEDMVVTSNTLASINASSVYIAFKYEFVTGSCSRWTVENFNIRETYTWTGTMNNNWAIAANWDFNTVPTPDVNTIIPNTSITNYPTINSATTVNSIHIESGASLIANATIGGNVTYSRNCPTNNWYLISSPVAGETVQDFIDNHTLATGTVSTNNLGLAPYNNTGTTAWSYYQNGATTADNFVSGRGFSVKLASAGDISFTGTINSSNVQYRINTGGRNNFNLFGNPFTSYINSNTLVSLTANSNLLSEETVWLWNGTDYVAYNMANGTIEIAPGQGFFVESSTNGDLTFETSNQSHQSTDTFLREVPKSSFELFVENAGNKKGTKVFYIDGKTKGFDNGYDSKLFGGVDYDFAIYTELLNDNDGRHLAIQSLPSTDIETMIIPIGLIAEANKEITFSIAETNLPSGVNIYLEDRKNNTFTNLSEGNHTITLKNASNGIGQFYIRTSAKSLSNEDLEENTSNISIYSSNNKEITITGLQNRANLKVFSVLGEELADTNINSNGVSKISLASLATGVYVIKLNSESVNITKKIILE